MIKNIFVKLKNKEKISEEYLSKEKEYNMNYEIIARACQNNIEIVLGQHIENKDKYVTWQCTKDSDNIKIYRWGNYFYDKKSAIIDFNQRVYMLEKQKII